MQKTKLMGCFLALGVLSGCEAQYDSAALLKGADAWACVDKGSDPDKCEGLSVELDGYVESSYGSRQYRILRSREKESQVFLTSEGTDYLDEGAKVRLRGLIVDSGLLGTFTTVKVHSEQELEPAPPPRPTPEEEIARNREMGRRALEEADAAIRANNADTKRALAKKAVAHHAINSGNTLIDVYRMPDGRLIGCQTVVYPSGAPITTCDGEP